MRHLKILLAVFIGLWPAAMAHAQSVTVLPPGHTWEYTFADPTGDPSWNTTTGGWATGPAPFATACGVSNPFDIGTYWPADGSDGDDLWVRTAIDLTGIDLSTVTWGLGVDNGFTLYANGGLPVASGNAEGYTFQWEYSGSFGSSLVPGVNVIAVALEDHGGCTAFDMEITGTPVPPVTDSDGDGVDDTADQCPGTPSGSLVDSAGCSGAQNVDAACPCEGAWKNHGKYVSCVAHASEAELAAGLLTEDEKDAIVSAAGESSCGK